MSNEPHDTANRVAGEILRIAVNVENDLERFIIYYILDFSNNKRMFLNDEILQRLSFQRKVELFEKIGKLEEFDKKTLKKIISDIKFIQETRNKVAHYESSFEGPPEHPKECNIRLWSTKSHKYLEDSIILDQELLNNINKSYLAIRKEITDVTNFLIEKDRAKDTSDEWLLNQTQQ